MKIKYINLLLTIVIVTNALSQSLVRGPYLQSATSNSIIIKWRTDVITDGYVHYGSSPSALNQTATDLNPSTDHIVTITGLSANTTYYYNVGTAGQVFSGGDNDHFFVTSPNPGSTNSLELLVIGDHGTDDNNEKKVRDAVYSYKANRHFDGWLMLGDNAYGSGKDDQYQRAVFEGLNGYKELLKNTTLWPTPGNHDLDDFSSNYNAAPYFNIFELPTNGQAGGVPSGTKYYYSFDIGNVHLVSLDTYSPSMPLNPSGAQATWLKQDLAANNKTWTVVFFHHPPHTHGTHDSDNPNDGNGEMREVRNNIMPICEQYGVDLILSGHSHVYERSEFMSGFYGRSAEWSASNHKVQGGSGNYPQECAYTRPKYGKFNGKGTIYAVVGSSGRGDDPLSLMDVLGEHRVMRYSNDSDLGFMTLEVSGNKLSAKWITTSGTVKDRFTIFKNINVNKTVNIPCPGASAKLTASWDGGPYQWNTGATSSSITVSPAVSTQYIVSGPQGCNADTFNVVVGPQIDAAISAISDPSGTVCGATFSPVMDLKNNSGGPMNNVTIKYQLDNGQVKTYNWSGNLTPGATQAITLPSITTTHGNHNFKAFTENPNGCSDSNPGNDQTTVSFKISIPDAGIVAVQQPNGGICSGNIQPVVTIKNFGQETITDLQVKYRVDGKPNKTYQWMGILAAGATINVTLPTENINAGLHNFSAFTINPNQCNDVNNNNNSSSASFTVSGNNDAGMQLVNRPFKNTCGNSIIPQVTFHNFSADTLYSALINYSIDNGFWVSLNWTGKVNPNTFKWAVYLPSATLSSFGNHTLKVVISQPNGCTDVQPNNDTLSYDFINVNSAGNTDASPSALTVPSASGDTVQLSFNPEIQLKNLGQNMLTSTTINYQLDGGSWNTFPWTGSVASQGVTKVTLSTITTTPGNHSIKIITDAPNGCNDTKPSNDTITGNFFVAKNDAALTSLSSPVGLVQADTILPEVILKNNSNIGLNSIIIEYVIDKNPPITQLIAANGGPGLPPGASINLKLNSSKIKPGNHKLTIYCKNPNTYSDYNRTDDTLRAVFSFLAKNDAALIAISNPVGLINNDSIYPEVTLKNKSNVALNSIVLEYIIDKQAPIFQAITTSGAGLPSGASINLKLNPVKINGGNHTFTIYCKNPNAGADIYPADDTIRSVFTYLNTGIATNNNATSITVYPNPTSGDFTVLNNQLTDKAVTIRIIDVLGNIVSYQEFDKLPSQLSFSLLHHPEGIYFLEIETDKEKLNKKIIFISHD